MRLILIRHAIAGNREEWLKGGQADEERPLTPEGVRRMRKSVRGLRRVLETPERLYSSPLLRARQTADILLDAYPGLRIEIGEALAPEAAPDQTLIWLAALPKAHSIALIGHEPHLSGLTALLVHGDAKRHTLPFKKGGTAILELEDIAPGKGVLSAFLPPRVLRALG